MSAKKTKRARAIVEATRPMLPIWYPDAKASLLRRLLCALFPQYKKHYIEKQKIARKPADKKRIKAGIRAVRNNLSLRRA